MEGLVSWPGVMNEEGGWAVRECWNPVSSLGGLDFWASEQSPRGFTRDLGMGVGMVAYPGHTLE